MPPPTPDTGKDETMMTERTPAPAPTLIDDPLLSVRDVCAALGVSKETVRKLVVTGALPAVDLGIRRTLVRKSDLEAYIAGRRAVKPTMRSAPIVAGTLYR